MRFGDWREAPRSPVRKSSRFGPLKVGWQAAKLFGPHPESNDKEKEGRAICRVRFVCPDRFVLAMRGHGFFGHKRFRAPRLYRMTQFSWAVQILQNPVWVGESPVLVF